MTKSTFKISLNLLSVIKGLLVFVVFHNLLIIHGIIRKIMFEYFLLYFVLFITIECDMKPAQKIVNIFDK